MAIILVVVVIVTFAVVVVVVVAVVAVAVVVVAAVVGFLLFRFNDRVNLCCYCYNTVDHINCNLFGETGQFYVPKFLSSGSRVRFRGRTFFLLYQSRVFGHFVELHTPRIPHTALTRP